VRLSLVGRDGQEVFSRWWLLSELDLFGASAEGELGLGGVGSADKEAEEAEAEAEREWDCGPVNGGPALPSPARVLVGLGLCVFKAALALAVVAAFVRRLARALWRCGTAASTVRVWSPRA
jgi:hypothetical protein